MKQEKFLFEIRESGGGFMAVFTDDEGIAFGGGGTTKPEAIAKATLMFISGLALPKSKGSSLPLDVVAQDL